MFFLHLCTHATSQHSHHNKYSICYSSEQLLWLTQLCLTAAQLFIVLNTKLPPQSLQTGGKHHGQKDNESYSVSAFDHRDATLLSGRWYSHVIAFRKQLYLFINSFRNSLRNRLNKLVKRAGSVLVWRRLQTEGCWPGWPTSGVTLPTLCTTLWWHEAAPSALDWDVLSAGSRLFLHTAISLYNPNYHTT